MKILRQLGFVTVAAAGLFVATANNAAARVSVTVAPPPACPYGYYEAPPYNCAPDGYYGPEWFSAGVFIGAGPWFHGSHDFNGHVDNRFDPHHGYVGPHPERGDKPFKHFHGNEMRDGRGHVGGGHAGGGHR